MADIDRIEIEPAFDPDPPTRAYVNILKAEIDALRAELSRRSEVMERAKEAVRLCEQKIVSLYRAATPQGNYDDEITIAGTVSGNNFADRDEAVSAARALLQGESNG